MKEHVDSLVTSSIDRLMNFLYRIDISEKQIALYEKEMPNRDYNEVLTELIIHRELKKVITRDYFRQQSNKNEQIKLD